MSNTIAVKSESNVLSPRKDSLIKSALQLRLPISKRTLDLLVLPLTLSLLISVSMSYTLGSLFKAPHDLPLPWRLMATVAISAASFLIALRLRGFVRIAVLMQLGAVSLILLYGFTMPSAPAFADVIAAIVCGGAASALTSAFALQQRQLESQSSEITLRRRQLRAAKLALVKQDEVERRLLAADLHDQVLHDLKLVKQTLNTCKAQLDEATLGSLQGDLAHAMSAVREVMDQLFPSSLEHLGLVGAIEECLDNAGHRCGFESFVRCKVDEDEFGSMTKVEELLLFRLIQEAVNNISKHAQAENVNCQILREGDELVFRITDDGVGFTEGHSDGRGLRYMKQRAELIGANIAWLPGKEGKGTIVEIRLAKLTKEVKDGARNQVTS
jgi:signal transduction histidine kinase